MKTIVIERVKPSIAVVKRLVDELGTTVGYLLGETAQINILKNPPLPHESFRVANRILQYITQKYFDFRISGVYIAINY
ncbi:hypothetical protein KO524_14670, partial [Flavobacterium sp. NKUCC04_CG]|nr:hypothetical protein [Flavobacterium sp. NKUCC04_CG]